jgi:hypothetical protein
MSGRYVSNSGFVRFGSSYPSHQQQTTRHFASNSGFEVLDISEHGSILPITPSTNKMEHTYYKEGLEERREGG